jgi:hypothetical protein
MLPCDLDETLTAIEPSNSAQFPTVGLAFEPISHQQSTTSAVSPVFIFAAELIKR